MTNRMESDWEHFHQTEQMKAVMGKEMDAKTFWKTGEERFHQVVALIEVDVAGMTVLEIGCGPGRILRPYAERAQLVVGVDVSSTAIETARRNLAEYENVELLKNDGSGLDGVRTGSIDLAVSFDVFQHMPTFDVQIAYLRETARVLTPGGRFAFQVKSDSGWLKIAGVPVLPRALRKYIPDRLVNAYLRMLGRRETRLRGTWRGHLFSHRRIREVFRSCGLHVDRLLPDGDGTRWIVVGRKH